MFIILWRDKFTGWAEKIGGSLNLIYNNNDDRKPLEYEYLIDSNLGLRRSIKIYKYWRIQGSCYEWLKTQREEGEQSYFNSLPTFLLNMNVSYAPLATIYSAHSRAFSVASKHHPLIEIQQLVFPCTKIDIYFEFSVVPDIVVLFCASGLKWRTVA